MTFDKNTDKVVADRTFIDSYDYMCNVVRKFTHSNVEDVVQDFYIKRYIKSISNYKSTESSFKSWLYVTLRNFYIDEYVRKSKIIYSEYKPQLMGSVSDKFEMSSDFDNIDTLTPTNFYDDLTVAIDDDLSKAIFLGFYKDGMSFKQLSERYHISESKLRHKNFTNRKKISKYFTKNISQQKRFLKKYGLESLDM